jgi:hypothetical protein
MIEIPGRLIGNQDRGPAHDCACNADALLFADRQLQWQHALLAQQSHLI